LESITEEDCKLNFESRCSMFPASLKADWCTPAGGACESYFWSFTDGYRACTKDCHCSTTTGSRGYNKGFVTDNGAVNMNDGCCSDQLEEFGMCEGVDLAMAISKAKEFYACSEASDCKKRIGGASLGGCDGASSSAPSTGSSLLLSLAALAPLCLRMLRAY